MKKESKIKTASKYALALYEGACEDGDLKAVAGDIDKLLDVLRKEGEIIGYLSNPLWAVEAKKDVLKTVAQKLNLVDETLNCLYVIADNNRFPELPSILESFKHIYYERHGIAEVLVESAKPLSKVQDEKLKANLKKYLNKEILINYEIKPEILGGLVITYGSEMIDDSIKGKLNRLELVMKGGQ